MQIELQLGSWLKAGRRQIQIADSAHFKNNTQISPFQALLSHFVISSKINNPM